MNKCVYCNRKSENYIPVSIGDGSLFCCCEECKSGAVSFVRYANRTVAFFVIGIIASVILALLGAFIPSIIYPATTTGVVMLGSTAIIFPFSTPQTIDLLGIRKSVIVVRIVGATLIIGALIWFLVKHTL